MNESSPAGPDNTLQLGRFTVQVVSGGRFRMDGGTMFGVVPRVLWSKYAEADEDNMLPQATNCLLVETEQTKVLIDTGYGGKLTEKQRTQLGAQEGAPLVTSLTRIGVAPDDIDIVVLSHLHFDHVGGGTQRTDSGTIEATFPRAEYVVQRREWMLATAELPELRGAYPLENLLPLRTPGRLRLLDGNVEIAPGIHALVTSGHTPGHQSILIESQAGAAVYLGDLCPTAAHLPPRWGTSYDLDVLQLRRSKTELLGKIADEGWWAFFDHDHQITHARLRRDDKRDFAIADSNEESTVRSGR
jgi:glyoxylase-like metal-dependent hydrolase (beta-lactamase superfamily II)